MSTERVPVLNDDPKQWEETKKKIVGFLERQIGEKRWDYFRDTDHLNEIALQFDGENGGRMYWLEETFRMYQNIASHRQLPSAERRKLYYSKTEKGNERLHHVVESQQFTAEEIEQYCDLALMLKKYDTFCTTVANMESDEKEIPPDILQTQKDLRLRLSNLLRGRTIINLFVQPSSRTHRSFESAEKMLGAAVINEKDPNMSSMSKGETGPDTIRTFRQYGDALVQRAPANYATEASILAQDIFDKSVPIINAGSGTRQHPTQALLDLMTIKEGLHLEKLSQLNGRTVTIVGDLLYGRTVRSLIYSLAKVASQVRIRLVSPKQLRIPPVFRQHLKEKGINTVETTNMDKALQGADVVYMTRVQQEWFQENKQMDLYYAIKDSYLLTEKHFQSFCPGTIVLHPLPRVNELSYKTDYCPQSHIWEQVKNGKYMRSALLLALFGKTHEVEDIGKNLPIERMQNILDPS